MNCPYCDYAGARREVHAHLVAEHRGLVRSRAQDDGAAVLAIGCPHCAEEASIPLGHGGKAAHLRAEMEAAVRMVLCDRLLYHLEGIHSGQS